MAYTDDPDVAAFEPKIDTLIRGQGIDPSSNKADFIRALYAQESSSGVNTKTSNRGAVGGMQVRPSAFKDVFPNGDPSNPEHQVIAGIRYANQGYDAANADPKLAATYYYGGPNGLAKAQKGVAVSDPVNPTNPNTLEYADQVVARMPKNTNGYDYSSDPDISAFGKFSPTNLSAAGAVTPEGHLTPQQIEAKVNTTPFLGRMKPTGPNPVAEALTTMATGLGSSLLGGAQGIVANITSPLYGTQKGIEYANDIAKQTQAQLTYQPKTQQGQNYIQQLQSAFETSKLPPIIPEAAGFAPLAGPAAAEARGVARDVTGQLLSPSNVAKPGPIDLAAMQQQFANRKAGVPVTEGLGSAGAAATADQSRVAELLTRASPELQNEVSSTLSAGNQITPEGLKALENRVKAEQFGLKLTEGEASQNLGLLSEEYNSKKTNEAMAQHLSERNPKLTQAFQDIRAQVAPDVFEPDPVKASNIALENMVQQDEGRKSAISANYQAAADANGGELPLSGENFVATANAKLKEANRSRFLPAEIQGILEDEKSNGNMPYNDFENYRTILAAAARKAERAGDGNAAFAIGQVRDALEATPMSEASAPVKALYDTARQSAKERFNLIDQNPAYKAAISDTRTPDEIAQGVLHPAANKFVDNFYGPKTPQVNINRLVDILGKDSEAHQGLNAAVIDKIAQASGVKGGPNDVVSQSTLNNQIRNVYQTNLPSMLPSEGLKKLQDLADVAALTEHVKPGAHSNVSGTAISQTPSPTLDLAKKVAEGAVQTGITATSPAAGVAYSLAKAHLTGRAAAKAAAAEAAAQAAKNAAPFREGAGISYTPINQIGK